MEVQDPCPHGPRPGEETLAFPPAGAGGLTGAVSGGEAWEGRGAPGAQGCRPQSGLSELLIQAVLPFPVVWKDFSSLGTWPHTRVHTCGCGRAKGPKELSARPM